MKKLFIIFTLAVFTLFTFTACKTPDDDENPLSPCTHRDADDNGKCDLCSFDFTDGCDAEHKDANDDGKCDEGGESFSDRCDKTPCRDANDNGKCDICGFDFADGCDLSDCRDTNDNGTCDKCGESFSDGCDALHTDVNDDGLCDVGGEYFSDGCDKKDCFDLDWDGYCDNEGCDKETDSASDSKCNHLDFNEDGLCDMCNARFEDGCSYHRDNNDDGKCDTCGSDFNDGCDAEHRDSNDDGLCDFGKETFLDGCDFHRDGNNDGECDKCSEKFEDGIDESSVGLEFRLNDDGESYTLTGIGNCTESVIVISTYNRKPVTAIANSAFAHCDSVISVIISDNVTSIGEHAFQNAIYLSSVRLGSGVTTISASAFESCQNLLQIKIPASTRTIGEDAFLGCEKLLIYCEAVRKQKNWNDNWNKGLRPVVWDCENNDLASDECFYTEFEGIRYKIMQNKAIVISQRHTLTELNVPEKITYNGKSHWVVAIDSAALLYCDHLTSVTLPSSVLTIGDYAFSGCERLAYVDLGGTRVIGTGAFSGCEKLNNITIPSSVSIMGSGISCALAIPFEAIFENPNGWYVYNQYTEEVRNLTYEELSNRNTAGKYLSLTYGGFIWMRDTSGDVIEECENHFDLDDDTWCDECGDELFDGCDAKACFDKNGDGYCDNAGCDKETENRPEPLPCYHRDCNDDSLCDECGEDFEDGSDVSTAGLAFRLNEDGESYTLTGLGDCTETDIVIGYYDGKPVTAIAARAFYKKGITSVTIGGVKTIGDNAFYNCASLTGVTIKEGVEIIGEKAFYNCYELVDLTIPCSITSIGEYAVKNSDKLCFAEYGGAGYLGNAENPYLALVSVSDDGITSFEIHPEAKIILSHVFQDFKSLTEIKIPDKVTEIGNYAFRRCTSLSSLTLGSSLQKIGESAFYGCSSIVYLTLPDSIKSIGSSAFRDCTNITKVYISDLTAWCEIDFGNSDANPLTYAEKLYLNDRLVVELIIPDGVSRISSYAFVNQTWILAVSIPESVTYIGKGAFSGCEALLLAEFISTDGWKASTSANFSAYTEISEDDLAYLDVAAEFLRETHSAKYWQREVTDTDDGI